MISINCSAQRHNRQSSIFKTRQNRIAILYSENENKYSVQQNAGNGFCCAKSILYHQGPFVVPPAERLPFGAAQGRFLYQLLREDQFVLPEGVSRTSYSATAILYHQGPFLVPAAE